MTAYKNKKNQIFLPLIIATSVIAGIIIGEILKPDESGYLSVKSQKEDKLNTIINYVESEYVDEIDRAKLEEMAIPKFLEALDPHTSYYTAEDTKRMEEELEGNFDGIGVQFTVIKDTVCVINVIKGGPSEYYGVFAGDRIIKVNNSVIAGVKITNDEVMKQLKGPSNSTVTIEVKRRGAKDLIPITIKRGSIPLYSIDAHYKIDDNIGYIKINNFARTTYSEFMNAIANLRRGRITSLIVDLRGNTGGYLHAATDVIDEFLLGDKMIVYTEGRARGRKEITSTNKQNSCVNLDLVVLIDDFSASASEIFAGAIQDNDRGFVIGRRSFGKGLVQEANVFNDGSMIRLTTARYYTPSGRSIQKPYNNGTNDYYSDIYNRYIHGEFLEKDSISFKDTIVYYTSLKREVYGGGGIMPDIFVPIDTSSYTPMYSSINKKNLEYIYAFQYVDNNRSKLKHIRNLDDLKEFMKDDDAYTKLWNYIENNGVKVTLHDKKISQKQIENNFLAYITRQVLDENNFYRVNNSMDIVVSSALNVLKTKRKLVE
jgi:carboxyl-terminal processing protease